MSNLLPQAVGLPNLVPETGPQRLEFLVAAGNSRCHIRQLHSMHGASGAKIPLQRRDTRQIGHAARGSSVGLIDAGLVPVARQARIITTPHTSLV